LAVPHLFEVSMTYVPAFTHDIFVSYPMEAEEWTNQLVEELRQAPGLAALKQLKLYFAKSDWRLGQASEDMLDAARNSALFIAVLTRDAVSEEQSRFISREVRAFRESGSLNGRFCPIPLHPVNSQELSRLVPSENPQSFWNTNLEFFFKEDGVAMWLEPSVEPRQGDYRKRVTKLSWHLRDRLDELKTRQRTDSAGKKGPFAGKAVLLARKEADIEREWHEVETLLRNDGVTLLSADELPLGTGGSNDAPQMPDLFVQLLSPLDPTENAKAQLAAIEALGSVPILQWRKQTNPKLLALMDEDDRMLFDGPRVVAVGLEEFKRDIREKLKELARPRAEIRGYEEKPYLYITADTPDLRYAREVQAVARKRTVADVMLEDESERRADFEEGLKRAAGVVFLYGDAERRFIDRWLKEYVRKTSLLQVHPKLVALYQAPPKKTADAEPLVPFDELRRVGSQEEFSLEPIEEICAELYRDRA
jgi:TIR domain